MSLGSPFGTADDASAVASTNVAKAGVIVVASSGNNGANQYIDGLSGDGHRRDQRRCERRAKPGSLEPAMALSAPDRLDHRAELKRRQLLGRHSATGAGPAERPERSGVSLDAATPTILIIPAASRASSSSRMRGTCSRVGRAIRAERLVPRQRRCSTLTAAIHLSKVRLHPIQTTGVQLPLPFHSLEFAACDLSDDSIRTS